MSQGAFIGIVGADSKKFMRDAQEDHVADKREE